MEDTYTGARGGFRSAASQIILNLTTAFAHVRRRGSRRRRRGGLSPRAAAAADG
eukprot:SAG31_NODE_17385_length_672_cov_1.884817_1_plen_53_part_10